MRELLVEHRLHRQDVGVAGVDAAERDGAAATHDVDRGVHGGEPVDAGRVHDLLRDGVGQQADRALRELHAGVAVRLHAHGVDDASPRRGPR